MRPREAGVGRAFASWAGELLRPLASDEAGEEFWGRHVRVGVAMTESSAVLVSVYVVLAERPQRNLLLIVAALVMLLSPLLLALPLGVLSSGVLGPLIFYLWSVAITGVVAWIAVVDGGADSPLLWLLVLTMTFAALAYPPPGVVLMGVLMVVAYLGVVILDSALTPSTMLVAAVLLSYTVMTAWVSRNHWDTYEQQLLLAARMAELDRSREEFVATTSHELRTPVASIIGYVELLEDSPEATNPHLPAFLAKIRRNAERLQGLSEDLLVLCHWHSEERSRDSDELPPGETDLADVAARAHETMAPLAARQQVSLEVDVASSGLMVIGARDQLERALLNLLSNAVKYTPAGGTVSCRLFRGAGEVVIEVHDTGIGIAEDELEALFRRFFRASSARERSIAGVGLGLSIVQEIVTSLGGRVEVSSRLGHGSSFVVRLPCAVSVDDRSPGRPLLEPAPVVPEEHPAGASAAKPSL